MKKSIPLVLTVLALIVSVVSTAQCTIGAVVNINGFTPASPDTITQQIPYSQTQQLYVNNQYFTATIVSITIDSIGGLPTGISYVINPASGTIAGGAEGAICFAGTTTDAVASYPLTFYATALVTNGGTSTQPLSDFPILGVIDTFVVQAAGSTGPIPHFTVSSPCYDSVVFADQSAYSPSSWSWTFTGGTPPTSIQQNPVVQYSSAGTYTATLVATNQSGSNSITQTVTAVGVPSASVVTTAATGPANANGSAIATGTGGTPPYKYNWSNTDTGASVSSLLPAQYTVTITDADGCVSHAATANVTYTTGLIQLTDGQQLKVYPNPVTDVLNLVFSQKPNSAISITDLNGKVINTFSATGGLNNVVDVSSLVTGAYVLRVTDISTHQQSTILFSKF